MKLFICKNFPSPKDDLCQDLLNWLSGSIKEDFQILLMYFCYIFIISPWKSTRPFIGIKIPFIQGCSVPSLVERARITNRKIGLVDLSKNKKWLSMSKSIVIQQMDPCWFHICSYDVIFKLVLELWRHKWTSSSPNTTFVLKLAKLVCYTPQPPIQFL